MRNIEELNAFVESLDGKIDEVGLCLENYVTDSELSSRISKSFNNLYNRFNSEIKALDAKIESSNVGSSESSNNCLLDADVYTKSEIDSMGFLKEHQSLQNYATRDYLSANYVKKIELCNYVKCNCIKHEELDSKLENYVLSKDLHSSLDDFYTKSEIDAKILDISDAIPSITSLASKNYVSNVRTSMLNSIARTYISSENADKRYFTISGHNDFSDYVEQTYLKKSDFEALGLIGSDSLVSFVTTSDLEGYALSESVDVLKDSIRTLTTASSKNKQKIESLSKNLERNYMKSGTIVSNFYTKSEVSDLFLSKSGAESDYLSKSTASKNYLTKNEAKYTYLSIEDYKSLKALMTINDSYKDDYASFNSSLENGTIIDGLYIVGDNVYVVKNGEAYQGMNPADNTNVYTRSEIDSFDFASKEWISNNLKVQDWVITNDY